MGIKTIYAVVITLSFSVLAFAGNNPVDKKATNSFIGMENTVGYITDDRGNKFIIIETEDGAKLVKVKENPKKLFNGSLGISKEDFNGLKIK
ncbi:MAG: hypothetical protein DSY66_01540 [Persephonella sp.]|nr:MAG: hypothetical protein DSY66_01540 [Persephonella sp.]